MAFQSVHPDNPSGNEEGEGREGIDMLTCLADEVAKVIVIDDG